MPAVAACGLTAQWSVSRKGPRDARIHFYRALGLCAASGRALIRRHPAVQAGRTASKAVASPEGSPTAERRNEIHDRGSCPLYVRAQPQTAGLRWTQRGQDRAGADGLKDRRICRPPHVLAGGGRSGIRTWEGAADGLQRVGDFARQKALTCTGARMSWLARSSRFGVVARPPGFQMWQCPSSAQGWQRARCCRPPLPVVGCCCCQRPFRNAAAGEDGSVRLSSA
jgi:hypothetical protein